MTLDELRKIAIYQNTVDAWIAACEEKNVDWYETENYKKFISYLTNNKLKMQKFSLCIKEAGGMYEEDVTRQNSRKFYLNPKIQMVLHTQ